MRSESPKIQENINKLLDAFNACGSLSTAEIMKLIGAKERKSVENYKTRLENQGYIFETVSGRPPKYRIINTERYENLTANILRKYLIMQELQNHPITKEEFPRHFTLSDSPDDQDIDPATNRSIGLPAMYHHLNNYGTTSCVVTIGKLYRDEIIMENGEKEVRDILEIGATVDERIADGFYFAKSVKLLNHVVAHPELLLRPLSEKVEY